MKVAQGSCARTQNFEQYLHHLFPGRCPRCSGHSCQNQDQSQAQGSQVPLVTRAYFEHRWIGVDLAIERQRLWTSWTVQHRIHLKLYISRKRFENKNICFNLKKKVSKRKSLRIEVYNSLIRYFKLKSKLKLETLILVNYYL